MLIIFCKFIFIKRQVLSGPALKIDRGEMLVLACKFIFIIKTVLLPLFLFKERKLIIGSLLTIKEIKNKGFKLPNLIKKK